MRDRDEVPYIVIEREGSGILPFLLGALLGAGVALLFAPRSGRETQEQIKQQARRLREAAEARMRDVQRGVETRLEQAREGVQQAVGAARGAVDAGKQAARDARLELERKVEQSKAAYRAGLEAARATATGQQAAEDVEQG
ncbi:MAG: YtxH domain-containing protein [Gemmatimonadetes bacterium]|nr:YtxH domain-containing protein [Gemmatimonadota bacterium]